MLFEDAYKTIAAVSEGIYRDKGSKFIAYAFPLKSEEAVKEILNQVKAEHPKARHHCWAWRLSTDKTVFRLNNDGEPSGSAGRPILNTLLSFEVTNVIVVVVRYFGGTLLGIQGLINAYKTATMECLKATQIIEQTIKDYYEISFDYSVMNDAMKIVKDEDLEVLKQEFDNTCMMEISIRQMLVNRVISKLEKVAGLQVKFKGSL